MKKVIDFIIPFVCVIVLALIIFNLNAITTRIAKLLNGNPTVEVPDSNEYAKNKDYLFVQKTKDYRPYNYQDLLNIYYSILDNGFDQLTFYCPSEYTKCLDDVDKLSNDQTTLSFINNYVHPYNSFENVYTSYDETGEITIKITKVYKDSDIKYINQEVNRISKEILNDNSLSTEDKIKTIHDYIINNTKYDERAEQNTTLNDSYTAYGLLKNHVATCNGYSDIMAIFLFNLDVDNYKIATAPNTSDSGHVWNAVNINNQWLHLDLTWDDPVSSNGIDYLYHKYFLVTNKALLDADSGEVKINSHNFKPSIYIEFKNAN